MKKLVLLISVIILTSCVKKSYNCECDYVDLVHGDKQEVLQMEAYSKASAQDYCEDGAGVHFVDFECRLK
jgi:hypothetical protein